MMHRRQFLVGAAALAAAPVAFADDAVSAAALAGDLAILHRAYETLHPGLYRYNTPSQMAAAFEALGRAWDRDQTIGEAYLSLSRFLAGVRCGHSYANFYNQKKAVAANLFGGRDKLPFHFRWLDRRMIVTDPKGVAGLARGDEIRRINGRASSVILRELMLYTRADGHNDAKRIAQLAVEGLDDYETFDVFHALAYPRRADGFDLEVAYTGKATTRIAVPAIDLVQRRAQHAAPADPNAPKFSLAFGAGGEAVLAMRSWALYDSKWDWKGFLDDAFRQIADRKSAALIVDLRGNEGGLDCGDEIIARCIDRDLARTAYERRVRYQKTPADLNPYLDTWDKSFKDWGEDAVKIDDRFYRLLDADGESRAPIRPKGPRISGKLIVLVDAVNSSATFQFANLVQSNQLGVLVGAPTGGNRRGINGGAFFFLRMPGSGLEADLPLIGTFPLTPQPDTGLQPDRRIAVSREDIAVGRDAVMQAAIGLAHA
jgi:hypothetical protein